jgi:NADH-quinone oxidoreductase subunit L
MVVAGVYLVARTMPLFEASDDLALYVVLTIGLITTFLSVFMGLVMSDIKRVVAYSTLNSLGLMMVALGLGESGVGAAMLYLFAHAFFKALLFLGCGSVIHATEKQEVEYLGGLSKKMPWTNITFLVGALAMAGMVPLSGFWAKDEILVQAEAYGYIPFILILITLPITAAYMLRVYLLTFQGEPKDHHVHDHAHEMPFAMTGPLILLASITLVAGFVVFQGVGDVFGWGTGFLETVEYTLTDHPHEFEFDVPIAIISTVLVGAGLVVAWMAWTGEMAMSKAAGAKFPFLYALFRNKFYIDDAYQWTINVIVLGLAKAVAFFDRAVVNDTGIDGPGHVAGVSGWLLKYTQTGKLPNYALAMAIGVAVLVVVGFSVKG